MTYEVNSYIVLYYELWSTEFIQFVKAASQKEQFMIAKAAYKVIMKSFK